MIERTKVTITITLNYGDKIKSETYNINPDTFKQMIRFPNTLKIEGDLE